MKILFVAEGTYPDATGGAHRVVYNHAIQLARRGHQVFIIVRRLQSKLPAEAEINGVKIYRYWAPVQHSAYYHLWPLFSFVQPYRVYKKLVKRYGAFDAICFHHPYGAWLILRNLPDTTKPLYCFHSSIIDEISIDHSSNPLLPLISTVLRRVERNVIKGCRCVFTLSHYMRQRLTNLYGEMGKVHLIPGGVDTHKFYPATDQEKQALRKLLGWPLDKVIFLSVRRLVKRTGVQELVEAIARLRIDRDDFFVVIVGDGYLRNHIASLVAGKHLANVVRLAGFVSDDDLPLYYRASDVFVLPTIELEGFGLSTVEALASGLTVLGTSVGATPEILGQLTNEWLIAEPTPGGIWAKLKDFLSYPAKYRIPQQAIRDFVVRNYDWSVIGDALETLIAELCGGSL